MILIDRSMIKADSLSRVIVAVILNRSMIHCPVCSVICFARGIKTYVTLTYCIVRFVPLIRAPFWRKLRLWSDWLIYYPGTQTLMHVLCRTWYIEIYNYEGNGAIFTTKIKVTVDKVSSLLCRETIYSTWNWSYWLASLVMGCSAIWRRTAMAVLSVLRCCTTYKYLVGGLRTDSVRSYAPLIQPT